MWANPCTARDVMERRYEFVSEGAQTTRWLTQFAAKGFRVYRNRLLQVASDALLSLGAWLERKRPLSSAHS